MGKKREFHKRSGYRMSISGPNGQKPQDKKGVVRSLSAFLFVQNEPVPGSQTHRRMTQEEKAQELRRGADWHPSKAGGVFRITEKGRQESGSSKGRE